MLANQQCYERGLEDLRIVFEGYVDKLRKSDLKVVKPFISLVEEQNVFLQYGLDVVRGVPFAYHVVYTVKVAPRIGIYDIIINTCEVMT